MEIQRSEDILIFNGLTPTVTKMNRAYVAIADFMKKKQEIDISDRFNFIAFQENGPTYLDQFSFEPQLILNTIKSLENDIVRANLAGGIFVAITFIIDVFKKISEKVFRLILLADKGSHKIPFHFLPVLEDLIEKVKDMPFFIDVILVNVEDVQEGQKLEGLVKKTGGKFFNLEKIKDLGPVLSELSEKKSIKIPAFYEKRKQPIIPEENKPFYANLGDEPLNVAEIGTCAICFQRDDTNLVQCPSCETIAHKKCWAQWAKTSNIGIFNVFRCHNCFNILKLDAKYVSGVYEEREPTEEELKKIKRRDMVDYLREQEAKAKPKIVQVQDPMAIEPDDLVEIESDDITEVDTTEGGPEIIEVIDGEAAINVEDYIKVIDEVEDVSDVEVINSNEVAEPIQRVKPTQIVEPIRRVRRNDQKIKIVICPNCSKITTSMKKTCPGCGFALF